jgi:general nucleoside transport system ATP-binding protein
MNMRAAAGKAPLHLMAQGLSKRYDNGVQANLDVCLRVARGQAHAIVGENGAGKSTLLKMLCGLERPDSGHIEVDGVVRRFGGPPDAIAAGLGLVPQHLQLVRSMTCAENVVLGSEPRRGLRLDRARANAEVAQLAAQHGLDVDPQGQVAALSAGVQQRVALLKVLRRGARLLLLDEPTALLTPLEVASLFESLRGLIAQGLTVVLVTHKLAEVRLLCERFTALRSGQVTGHGDVADCSDQTIAELMFGAALRPAAGRKVSPSARTPSVAVRELTLVGHNARAELDSVSFDVAGGEIFGVAGVEGNGQDRLAQVLSGALAPSAGTVHVRGVSVAGQGVRHARDHGVGWIHEDRLNGGLAPGLSLAENTWVLDYAKPAASRWGLVDRTRRDAHAGMLIQQWAIRARNEHVPVAALSGGNMQKVLVGRELAACPRLLIASQPTRGVDLAASRLLRQGLLALRDQGAAIVLVSADLDELLELADRIGVMLAGRLVAHVNAHEADAASIGRCMTGLLGTAPVAALIRP